AWRPPVTGAVERINKAASGAKLDGQEVSRADVDRSPLSTAGVSAARQDLVGPEVEATFIRLATEEVQVMLSHEELCRVDGVARNDGIARGGEDRIGHIREQREGAARGTKVVVHQ